MPKCALCGREVKYEEIFQREGKIYCSASCMVEDREIDGYRKLATEEMNYKKKILLLLVIGCPFIFISSLISYFLEVIRLEINLILINIVIIVYFILYLRERKYFKLYAGFGLKTYYYGHFAILLTLVISFDFIILFYFTVSEGALGYTFGKRVFNLNVGDISYGQAVTRNITKAFFFTIPYIALADLIWMLLASDRRRLTEVISRTKVLYEPKLEVEYKWQGEF